MPGITKMDYNDDGPADYVLQKLAMQRDDRHHGIFQNVPLNNSFWLDPWTRPFDVIFLQHFQNADRVAVPPRPPDTGTVRHRHDAMFDTRDRIIKIRGIAVFGRF
jgi:hypothetical protein